MRTMKSLLRALLAVSLLATTLPLRSQSADTPVDFDKARQLFEKREKGTTLTPEETAYIERAKAQRGKQQGDRPNSDGIDWQKAQDLYRREQSGEKLSPEDQKYLDHAKEVRGRGNKGGGTSAAQRKAPTSLKPLSDMTADETYEGEDGGLYGKGSNQPPEALQKAASAANARIQPLDAAGKPAADGRIVLVSISMSNATMEFSTFKRIADADARKSDKLTIVDCAQGGQAMAEWVPAEGGPWQEAMKRIANAQVTPEQVQIAWIKLANKGPSGSITDHLGKLEADTTAVIANAKKRFPNLRIAYFGSRIWAGNAASGLNPEPYAYEGAFAVRHLILKQPAESSPTLLWGPYLWSEGEKGRKLDDLKYPKEDFAADGTHPSESGREKVARQLLEFFAKDSLAKAWFTGK